MLNHVKSKCCPSAIRHFGVFQAVVAGFFSSLFIAVPQVYQSNIYLYQKLSSIQETDFLLVPTLKISPNLLSFSASLGGGAFFSFSIGIALALLSYGLFVNLFALRIRHVVLQGLLIIAMLIGFICLYKYGGAALTGYFLLVPSAVLLTMNKSSKAMLLRGKQGVAFVLPFLIFIGLTAPFVGPETFVTVRDNLLLSNAAGSRINDFYYRYTLYPAEAFKSLEQQLIKTYFQQGEIAPPYKKMITQRLLAHDYLPVENASAADLVIDGDGKTISFSAQEKEVLEADLDEFVEHPEEILRTISEATDSDRLLRNLTYFSMIFNLIVIPYISLTYFLQGSFCLLNRYLPKTRLPPLGTGVICCLVMLGIVWPFVLREFSITSLDDLPAVLQDANWRKRVNGLQFIVSNDLDIGQYNYQAMLRSAHVPERYWLARALGKSKQSATFEDLETLLHDKHPNVVCMGMYGLGQRGNPRVAQEIKHTINTSQLWYVQMYGYKALKALGWQQGR